MRRTAAVSLFFLLPFALPACNAAMVEQEAPALSSSEWVLPEGAEPPVVDGGRWRVLAFFAPT